MAMIALKYTYFINNLSNKSITYILTIIDQGRNWEGVQGSEPPPPEVFKSRYISVVNLVY